MDPREGIKRVRIIIIIIIRGLPFMTSALRGRGVPSKADIVSNLKGGCVNLRTREGNLKFLQTSLMDAPSS